MDQVEGDDDSLMALLLLDDEDDDGDKIVFSRELPAEDIWDASSLVKAWSAAMSEFQSYASASTSASSSVPLLDREQQLIASPLWYAPPCRPIANNIQPIKRTRDDDEEEQEEEEEEGEEYEGEYDEEDAAIQEASPTTEMNLPVISETETPVLRSEPFIHPSRAAIARQQNDRGRNPNPPVLNSRSRRGGGRGGGAVDEGMPYFNASEWVAVNTATTATTITTGISSNTEDATNHDGGTTPSFPQPPPIEHAITQDPALLASQTPEQAIEKALHAWYTAGYAAALYHVRSGAIKP